MDGKRLVAQGRYPEACAKLEQSLRLDSAAGTQINLADCYERAGRFASAWVGFHSAVVMSRQAGHADWAEQARQRASLLERRVPRLTIEVDDPSPALQVSRNGAPVSTSTFGSPVPLDPGTYEIVAFAPTRQRWATQVVVETGAEVVLHVPPLPLAEAAPTPREPTGNQTTPVPTTSPSPLAQRYASPTEGGLARTAAWTTAGAGAVLLVGGIIALIVRQTNVDAYNNDGQCLHAGLTREESCGSYRGVASTAETFAIAQLGAGIAAAAASTTLFVVTSRRDARPRFGCHLGTTLTCGATF